MTALNVILRPDVAYLVTDGMILGGAPGTLPRTKVALLPQIDAALAFRGWPVLLGTLFTIMAHRHASFDAAAEGLGEDLQDAWEPMRKAHPVEGPQEAVLVGFPRSASAAPRCATAASHDGWGREPYSVAMCSAVLGPNDGTLAKRLGRDFTDPAVPFDPHTDAVALIRAQAAMPGSGVGAFCQLTTLTREAISTRIMQRWPDVIGDRLGA